MTRQLVITVRNLESYAEVAAALLSVGVAADNPAANAGFLAARLGRELVTVKRIVDRSVANQLPVCARAQMMRAESMDAAAVPEENLGTERINASVFVEFELE